MTSQADDAILAGFAEAERDEYKADLKHEKDIPASTNVSDLADDVTEEDKATLRRVPGKVPWQAYLIATVELAERFSYYGTTVVFTNFIQRPLPPGSRTGAGFEDETSGALGMGQRASFGLTTYNTFWVYVMPLLGAYVADTYLGRYKTICWAVLIALIGHILLVVSAVPTVIVHPNGALGAFIIAIIIMGVGTGAFKSNISPLIAEQTKDNLRVEYVRHEKIGAVETKLRKWFRRPAKEHNPDERVLVDPALTAARIFMYFYLFINIGALVGQIGMAYSEKYVGFWLAYTLPTVVFLLCPIVLWVGNNRYVKTPPQGSVLAQSLRLWRVAAKGRWSWNPIRTMKNFKADDFWTSAYPSKQVGESKPKWMTFDDRWVDEVRRGFKACSVFVFFPIYWLTYNQMTGNLTSQAATMTTHGVPNDVINNLDPFALIILIPICDLIVYPALARAGIRFTPIKKIFAGFMAGSASMVWAAVVQHYIYKTSPCGNQANGKDCDPSPLNVWIQSGSYVLIALSEIFASITGLEYAFTKAPKNMRSLVTAVFLFTSAIASAIGEAFVALSDDPLLVWNYGVFAVLAFVAGIAFWITFRHLDAEEDKLNELPEGEYGRH